MKSEEKKYYYPNTTQKPNIVFDVIMPKIGREKPLAYLVLDAMIRKIYGWGKQEDNISNSQLVEMTGLSPDTVRDSVEYLIKNKFVEQLIKGHGKTISRYRLTLNEYIANEIEAEGKRGSQQPPLEVANSNLSKNEGLPKPTPEVAKTYPRGSQQPPPEVANSYPQNLIKPTNQNLKEKEEKKNDFPPQEKVSKFFEHHLETIKKSGSRETEMFNVDKLGILLDWNIEEYNKVLYTKENSSWEPRRKQPNTARWLIATLQNEAIVLPDPNSKILNGKKVSKFDLIIHEEMRAAGKL